MVHIILVINPGSTSTKIAIFENTNPIFETTIQHKLEEILQFPNVISQKTFRKDLILESLDKNHFDLHCLSAVCGRGGMLRPMESGTYLINESMIDHLINARTGQHASNLGAIIANEIGNEYQIPAFIVDPVSTDEMEPIARISGMPLIERQSFFHALNHKAIGKRAAKDVGCKYQDLNLIITHLGGGISVAVHQKGKVVDVNDSQEGDGPMSPERSGGVPLGQLYRMCFSNNYQLEDIIRMNHGKGGLVAYLGTNNAKEIVERINHGDTYAKLIYDAMIYQVAKEIGACATVLKGKVDYIILTGGLAYEPYLVSELKERINFIGNVLLYPGENEMLSLAEGALRVLNNEEKAKNY